MSAPRTRADDECVLLMLRLSDRGIPTDMIAALFRVSERAVSAILAAVRAA